MTKIKSIAEQTLANYDSLHSTWRHHIGEDQRAAGSLKVALLFVHQPVHWWHGVVYSCLLAYRDVELRQVVGNDAAFAGSKETREKQYLSKLWKHVNISKGSGRHVNTGRISHNIRASKCCQHFGSLCVWTVASESPVCSMGNHCGTHCGLCVYTYSPYCIYTGIRNHNIKTSRIFARYVKWSLKKWILTRFSV